MTEFDPDRRTFVAASGAALTIGLAGCLGGGGDDNGDGNGNGNGNGDGTEIDPGTTIELDGLSQGWEGLAPSSIEGDVNPTLVLQEGESYTMEFVNGDGASHDLVIQNSDESTVNDLATDVIGTEDESASLEFEASTDMVEYICTLHPTAMVGDLVVE